MSISLQLSYRCSVPGCNAHITQDVTSEEVDVRDEGEWRLAAENMPVGWAVIVVNAVGVVGYEYRIACSADCVAGLLDRLTSTTITPLMG